MRFIISDNIADPSTSGGTRATKERACSDRRSDQTLTTTHDANARRIEAFWKSIYHPECPSSPSIMPPSRSKGKERPCGPSQPGACASMSSSSSLKTSSSESSPSRRIGGFTLRHKLVAKASSTKGGFGSRTISTPSTLLNYACMHKTKPNRQEDRVSKAVSSPELILLSLNYFDVLSKEGDAPRGEIALQET